MKRKRVVLLTMVALAIAFIVWPAVAQAEEIERVSVDTAGDDAIGPSEANSISADGTLVTFGSSATDLVPTDANGATGDVFVRDLESGVTELVSVDSDEVQGNNVSSQPDISPDGRYVAFQSLANNLVDTDAGGFIDIFVRDLVKEITVLVSQSSGGTQANGNCEKASITSDDTRVYVAYSSTATNLVAGDANSAKDVFLSYFYKSDPSTVVTEMVSRDSDGNQGANGMASGNTAAAISDDGKYVTYASQAQLAPTDNDVVWDVYVTEWEADNPAGIETKQGSLGTGGNNTVGEDCWSPSISGNGEYVAYHSQAIHLTLPDADPSPPDQYDVFVTDWNHEDPADVVTVKASVPLAGVEANGDSTKAVLSRNGRYVAFESTASDLVEGDDNGNSDVFIRDLDKGVTYLMSQNSIGELGNDDSHGPAITSTPGTVFPRLSFFSYADNLVKGVTDANGQRDVFATGAIVKSKTGAATFGAGKRYEQTDERIYYTGGFDEEESDTHSDGSVYFSVDKDFSATITFKGTKLDWIGTIGPDMGQVMVSVDGGEAVLVDLSNPETLSNTVVWTTGTLAYGVHVVKIYFPEDAEASELKPISIDALDIYDGYLMKTEPPKEEA